jgi:hypothetical protein
MPSYRKAVRPEERGPADFHNYGVRGELPLIEFLGDVAWGTPFLAEERGFPTTSLIDNGFLFSCPERGSVKPQACDFGGRLVVVEHEPDEDIVFGLAETRLEERDHVAFLNVVPEIIHRLKFADFLLEIFL